MKRLGAACDIAKGKLTLRAVIWRVEMVAINPRGVRMIKPLFCSIARESSPINFGLIAHKHGTQAAQRLFPETPWLCGAVFTAK